MARFRGEVIVLRRAMLRGPEEALFGALYELGHVALGHQRPAPVGAVAARLLLALVGPLVLGPVLAGWWGVRAELGLFLGVLVSMVLLAVVASRWLHSCEYAADRRAAERGGVLTEELARSAYGWPHPWRQAVEVLWSTHPAMVRRVHRVSDALSAGAPGR